MCKATSAFPPVVSQVHQPQMQMQTQAMQVQPQQPQVVSHHSNLIRRAAYLNREGATALVLGDLPSAVNLLSQALQVIVEAGGFDSSPSIMSDYMAQSFPFERQAPCSLPSQLRHKQVHKLSESSESGFFFVYSNPFIFHPITVEVPDYATNCAAVCLFNLGLAYHQRGRLADSAAVSRAHTLYNMSLALVAQMPCQAACMNLKVAGTNNLAHVLFEVCESAEAKTTLQALLAILSANKTTSPPPFGDVEIEKFYMNILYVNGSTLAGAA